LKEQFLKISFLLILVMFTLQAPADASAAGRSVSCKEVFGGQAVELTLGQKNAARNMASRVIASYLLNGTTPNFVSFDRARQYDDQIHVYMKFTDGERVIHVVSILDLVVGRVVQVIGPEGDGTFTFDVRK
jgi:hypothetical protein